MLNVVVTPVTTPVGETVAMLELLLVHTPPTSPVGLLSVMEAPEQTLSAPVMAPANGVLFMEIFLLELIGPQP